MSKMQSKYIKTGILAILLFLSFGLKAQTGIVDKIVAQIGEEIIMLSDIQKAKLQMLQEGIEVSKSSDCGILEDLLFQKLLINQAKIDSVEVSDDAVNSNMEQRIRYFEAQIGGREKLEEFYGKSIAQIKAEFFMIIKDNMLAERMREIITENLVVTPKDVETFYNSLPKDSIPYINSKISVAQLVLYPEVTEQDRINAKNKIEKIRKDVMDKKMRFGTAAIRFSDDTGSRLQEGDLGWQTKGTMVPEFEAMIFSIKENEVSEVFETQFGYHFLELLDRRGDNYHCRHILISTKADDRALDIQAEKIEGLYRDIKSGKISFTDAVKQYSMDENSKINMGKIVNPYTNDFYWDINNINEIDPQLYRIIKNLGVGKVSSPSLYENIREQKEGLRIVKLLNKTSPHLANLNDDYQLIQNACAEIKKQEIIDRWINNKITEAYVRVDGKYTHCAFKYNWLKK